ncbi:MULTISPECIES: DUF6880 family protein [Alphaproteobacteria]|uniref:DUF6880 family protein n=1 Tax=Alphaproteobacteria TaxID=28211 RepID=UPI0032EEFEBB
MDFAETYPRVEAAVGFLVDWSAHARAARVVMARADELDGNSYHTLSTTADAIEAEHPLSATLMRRAMIEDSLDGAKSKRYRHAARHLEECQSCDAAIEDHGDAPTHAEFVTALKEKHPRKHGFWRLTNQ